MGWRMTCCLGKGKNAISLLKLVMANIHNTKSFAMKTDKLLVLSTETHKTHVKKMMTIIMTQNKMHLACISNLLMNVMTGRNALRLKISSHQVELHV